jgi:hypothetical protein
MIPLPTNVVLPMLTSILGIDFAQLAKYLTVSPEGWHLIVLKGTVLAKSGKSKRSLNPKLFFQSGINT